MCSPRGDAALESINIEWEPNEGRPVLWQFLSYYYYCLVFHIRISIFIDINEEGAAHFRNSLFLSLNCEREFGANGTILAHK